MASSEQVRHKCVTHILKRLQQAEVSEAPFPHFFVDELFPTDVYAQMIASMPGIEHYKQLDKYNQGAASTRHRMSLESSHLANLPSAQSDLWNGVRDAIGDPTVKRLVFKRLASGLKFRFGISDSEVEDAPGYPMPELYRETTGYSIKPHPDTRRKVVTMQISLSADQSQQHLGTEFYRISMNPLSLLRFPRGFEKVKQMPFSPNSGYAFVVLNTVTKRSWHGRGELPPNCGVRNSLLHLYYADPADANTDLVAKYYPKRAA